MNKWHWIVRERENFHRQYEYYKRGYTDNTNPHIYSEGDIEGTKQDAINRAKLDKGSYNQIIKVKRIK